MNKSIPTGSFVHPVVLKGTLSRSGSGRVGGPPDIGYERQWNRELGFLSLLAVARKRGQEGVESGRKPCRPHSLKISILREGSVNRIIHLIIFIKQPKLSHDSKRTSGYLYASVFRRNHLSVST
jgi:hypothetical protein